MDKRVLLIAIMGTLLIIIGILFSIVDMFIDHECYQLQPNDKYVSSICERYWK